MAGEGFDLVVSNPPFVITPRSLGEAAADQFTYRDGGLPGDDIVASLVRALPSVLAPGGTAQLLGNWEIPAGAPGTTGRKAGPARTPTPGSSSASRSARSSTPRPGCRTPPRPATGGCTRTPTPRTWTISPPATSRPIGFGMIWLRRRRGRRPVLRRFEEITYPIEQPVGPHLGAAVERADWLAATTWRPRT